MKNGLYKLADQLTNKERNASYLLAVEYAKGGQFYKARRFLQKMSGESKIEALITIGLEYSKVGREDKAEEIFSEARRLAGVIYDAAKGRTLGVLAGAYAESGDYDKAFELVKVVQQEGKRDRRGKEFLSQYQDRGLTNIGVAYAKTGQYKKALGVSKHIVNTRYSVQKTDKRSVEPKVLTQIGIQYAKAGDFKKANEITKNCYDPFRVLAEIAVQLKKRKKVSRAKEVFLSAVKIAESAKHPNARGIDLMGIAMQLIDSDEFDWAISAVTDKEIEYGFKAIVLSEIGARYASKGKLTKAFEIAKKIHCSDIGDTAKIIARADSYLTTNGQDLTDEENKILTEFSSKYANECKKK